MVNQRLADSSVCHVVDQRLADPCYCHKSVVGIFRGLPCRLSSHGACNPYSRACVKPGFTNSFYPDNKT